MTADRDQGRDRIVPPEAADQDPDGTVLDGDRTVVDRDEDMLMSTDRDPNPVRPVPERGSMTTTWVVGGLLLLGLIIILILAIA